MWIEHVCEITHHNALFLWQFDHLIFLYMTAVP